MDALYLTLCLAIVPTSTLGVEYDIVQQPVELDTSLGTIQGRQETVLSKPIDIFLGIPFAKPPTGKRRFRRPEPYGSWSDRTLDATQLPNSCPQAKDFSFNSFAGSTMWNPNTNITEDCLYLNIWSPSGKVEGGRTVLVWIYGGGFTSGTSTLDWYDGRILASKGDVVVVSMQYRVAATGFMYLGTPEVPGNMGMLDQQLALKWIHANIAEYGGNPELITLFGESAGAVSVGFHLILPESQNLFSRGILQSSTPHALWAVDPPADAKAKSLAIAAKVGCKDGDLKAIHACLMDIPHEDLTNAMWEVGANDDSSLTTPLVPTVDGYFFKEHPFDIMADKSIKRTNILLGVNSNEGAYFLPYQIPSIFNLTWDSVTSHEKYLEGVRQLIQSKSEFIAKVVGFEYLKQYHYRKRPSYGTLLGNILGDSSFVCSVVNFAQLYNEMSENVYLYKFDHITSASPWPKRMGVLHGYEIDIVFGQPLNRSLTIYNDGDRELSERIIQHWVNFAETGNPTQRKDGSKMSYDWPEYTLQDRRVLVLNTTSPPKIQDGLLDRKCDFWNELMPQLRVYGKEMDVTCGSTPLHFSSSVLIIAAALLCHLLAKRLV